MKYLEPHRLATPVHSFREDRSFYLIMDLVLEKTEARDYVLVMPVLKLFIRSSPYDSLSPFWPFKSNETFNEKL